MIKLFERIFWHNNTTPAINEDNLNAMSKAIDDIDNRVIDLGADVMEVVPQIQAYLDQAADLVEAMELLTKNPPYIGANGNWYVWDTDTSSFVDSGIDASITVQIADVTMLAYGTAPYITNSGTSTDPVFHLFIPRAAGITSITKTGTSGLVDTYTVTFQDGNTSTFQVTNGKGIVSIAKTSTSGQVDTYTITFNDSTTTTFTVTNGNGDMNKSTYDPQSAVENAGGIPNYVSGAVSSLKSAFTNYQERMGTLNLFENYGKNVTSEGVKFTVNSDGTVTANGTARADVYFSMNRSDVGEATTEFSTGKSYRLSGCPSGGSSTTYGIKGYLRTANDEYISGGGNSDYGDGVEFNVASNRTLRVQIFIANGQTVSNLTFKPMITTADTPNSDYAHFVPYAKTNRQLTEDSVTWNNLSEVGAVNYLDSDATTQVISPVTWTVSEEKIVTAVASSSLSAVNAMPIKENFTLKKGTYRLSGCPSGGDYNTYRLQIYTADNITLIGIDLGKGVVFTLSADTAVRVVIRLGTELTAGTYTFKPMITDPSYNGPYVPYAKTNKELTDNGPTVKTINVTAESGVGFSSTTAFKQCGKNVILNFKTSLSIAANTETLLFTLPEGSRPSARLVFPAFNANSDVIVGFMIIKANGEVSISSTQATAAGAYYGGVAQFFAS